MFENYINKMKEEDQTGDHKQEGLQFMNNILADQHALHNQIVKIQTMTDSELYEFALKFYNLVLENIFSKNDKMLALQLFTNVRFVNIFNQVIRSANITDSQRTYVNKLAYDYWIMPEDKKDDIVKDALLNLTRTANRDIIPRLLSIGLPEQICALLAMARFSSLKESLNVKRLNVFICNQSPEVFTEGIIVKVYCALFNRITPLFNGIMFDAWEPIEGLEIPETYSVIDLAILDILEQLPTDMIRSVLLDYTDQKHLLHPNDKVRFDIRAISVGDYPRISGITEYLEKEEKVFLPA